MAKLLKGAPVASAMTETLREKSENLRKNGVIPTLAIVRVGEKPEDLAYERGAEKRMALCGIAVRKLLLDNSAGTEEILSVIEECNRDTSVHGILLFLPLPKTVDEAAIVNAIAPEKDVDGVTMRSMACVYAGRGEGFAPCTAEAVVTLLKAYEIPLSGARVTVVGRSLVIGKPVSLLLMRENATVTVCHTKTKDLAGCCREADILVAAAGKRELIGESCLSNGQTVVDVGIHTDENGNLCGDVESGAAERICLARTPVPGGVGSMTTTVLASHVLLAAERSYTER